MNKLTDLSAKQKDGIKALLQAFRQTLEEKPDGSDV